MARNDVQDWQDFEIEARDVATIRAIIEKAFKAAGGRGELPKALSVRNVLKGSVSCDARAFKAGNAEDDGDVALAKAWAEAIAEGRGALADLAEWPGLQKMVATMLRPVKAAPRAPAAPPAPPAPKAKAAPAPAPVAAPKARRLGAEHGVGFIQRKPRAA